MPTFEHYSQKSKDFFLLLMSSVKHLGGLDAEQTEKHGEDFFFPADRGKFLRGLVPTSYVKINWIKLVSPLAEL